jgi:cystathionine beta-synthase
VLPDAQPAPHAVTGLLQLIGKTPLVRVTRLDAAGSQLWLKLESANPGGSIKDRIGLSMIGAAEAAGALRRGARTKLVEATAGNTGLGLALVSALRGYSLTLVIPDKMSIEKITHLRALGARVILTRSDVGKGHPAYYQDLARAIAERERAFYVNQFENPANPAAHERTTGPEIWQQIGGRMDAMVCGVGSGGTITGLSRFFAKVGPQVEMILADPEGSVLAEYTRTKKIGTAGSWLVEGIGEDFVPPICDLSRVARAYTIPDREAFATVRELLLREGILAGTSSGVLIAAALRWCRERAETGKPAGRVVTIVPDSGAKYLSKAYSDPWLADHGMIERAATGDLRDLVARRAADGALISVAPGDPLSVAYARMRASDVSQLPVLDDRGALVGIVDESDVLVAASGGSDGFARPIADVMSSRVETLEPGAPIAALLPLFEQGKVGVVVEPSTGALVGLVTRVDLINHLRRTVG